MTGIPTIPSDQLLLGKQLAMGEIRVDPAEIEKVKENRLDNVVHGLPSSPVQSFMGDARIAVVGFGPSLRDTWEKVREPGAIITTSKAHDFLLARGIVPTYHLDVDYRQHKATFIKEFHPDVQYVLATHVHPDYVDRARAAGAKVWLFHSWIPDGGPYEYGYQKIAGMFDAGLQAAKVAYDWGFRVQDWFGVDASFAGDESHAGPHEGFLREADNHSVVVGGITYATNGLLVRQALWAEKMLRAHGKLKATIHGSGMMRPFLLERRRVQNVAA